MLGTTDWEGAAGPCLTQPDWASRWFPRKGLHLAVLHAPDTPEVYSGGLLEWLVQGSAVALTQASGCGDGFGALALTAIVASALLLTVVRPPEPAPPQGEAPEGEAARVAVAPEYQLGL